MEKNREVIRLMSVFNLKMNKTPHLPDDTSTRIMLVYDKVKNIREYKILDSGMTEETDRRIKSWLEENIKVDDVIHGLNSSDINADDFQKAVGS